MSWCHVIMSCHYLMSLCHVMISCHYVMSLCHVIISCHYLMSLSHVIMSDSWVCNTVSIPLAGRLQAAPDSVHFVRILVGCRSSDLLPSWCHALDPPNHYCAAVHRTFECHRSQPTTTTTQSARLHDCCSVGPILHLWYPLYSPKVSALRTNLRRFLTSCPSSVTTPAFRCEAFISSWDVGSTERS